MIDPKERNIIRYVSMGMYENYRDMIDIYFPNALFYIDSFHVIKTINDSLNKIRCKVMNGYSTVKQVTNTIL